MADGFFHRYLLGNGGKRLHKWAHYPDIYERHLERFRNRGAVMLEIGVAGGGSLPMWRDYLGEGARIIGLDINPACKKHEVTGTDIFIGSQVDRTVIDAIFARYPRIDIVLDDGSHINEHMVGSFGLIYDRVHPNGVYMIEDMYTAYKDQFGGGLRREGSLIEFVKDKLDELHAVHTRGRVPVSTFTRSTDHIACYDSIIVFERRPQGERQPIATGAMKKAAPPLAEA
ncbi:hypothetical protein [Sphingomonas sp. ID0503]|uniref:hypothetical protein n=1 Tax=Sphingomonas sp. ID0503 TaxID=3399691 RepID=UPI003AFA7ABA